MAIANYEEMRDHVNDAEFKLRRQVGFELEKRFPDHFIPRYSLVSFHTGPYSEAKGAWRKSGPVIADIDQREKRTFRNRLGSRQGVDDGRTGGQDVSYVVTWR